MIPRQPLYRHSGNLLVLALKYQRLQSSPHRAADFLRLRAIPFTEEVTQFIEKYDQVFVVEMNRDGQMRQILLIEYPQFAMKLKLVAHHDGLPASAKWVREGILAKHTKTVSSGKKAVISKQKAVKGKPKKTAVVAIKAKTKKITKKTATGKTVKKTKRK